MRRPIRVTAGFGLLAAAWLFADVAAAQQSALQTPQQVRAYDVRRETSIQGTVVTFNENSSTPPLGARVSIQTSSGILEVHLGNASLLQANHLNLAPGDSIRVIGETLTHASGTQFFARVVQKGNQAVMLRSTRGFPLRPVPKAGQKQAGVL